MRVSGFSIIRDGVRFGYPFVESIRSLLPLVDEFVLAVGKSSDETLAWAQAIDSPKLHIFETEWDEQLRRGGQIMAQQTNLALDRCSGDWCFYLQGDEVIHEQDYDRIANAMRRYLPQQRVEGLSFRYRHFYGSYRLINPLPYRRQIRIVRSGIGVRSVGDACGFDIDGRKLRSKQTGAQMYHYGWVRDPAVQARKLAKFSQFYWENNPDAKQGAPPPAVDTAPSYHFDTAACVPFEGSHPQAMAPAIAAQDWPEPPYRFTPRWRNAKWWDGFFKKNFMSIYRHVRKPQSRQVTEESKNTGNRQKAA